MSVTYEEKVMLGEVVEEKHEVLEEKEESSYGDIDVDTVRPFLKEVIDMLVDIKQDIELQSFSSNFVSDFNRMLYRGNGSGVLSKINKSVGLLELCEQKLYNKGR